jgi:D-beta-D-heptose 7-phosphate kinase / D-beta-D-heptose 1-phosphate adenosyltransferase
MILVIGDVILDVFKQGPSTRLSPEAPVPVITNLKTRYYPGGAANVAMNTAGLGIQTMIRGVVGADEEGTMLENILHSNHNIVLAISKTYHQPTIVKTRIMANNQQVARIDTEEEFPALTLQEVFNLEGDDFKYIVVSDYNKGNIGNMSNEFKIAREKGIKVLVDPKKEFRNYAGAWLIKPNFKEFCEFLSKPSDFDDMRKIGQAALEKYNIEYMLVTLGEGGMVLISAQGLKQFDAPVCDVYDITGAGDSSLAGLVYGLSKGKTLEESVELAIKAGSVAVTNPATYQLRQGDLQDKIVFTNGVFDIIHAGHIKLLEQAKKLGDRLVVAINSDASVRRLKGDSRPINDEETRAHTLRQFSCVDEVIVFHEDTPYDLIEELKPSIIVKGGDYTKDQVIGSELVDEVVIIPLEQGYSTTNILGKINE